MKRSFELLSWCAGLVLALVTWLAALGFLLLGALGGLTIILLDVNKARKSLTSDGQLVCPRGHVFAIGGEDLVFECTSCSFVYTSPHTMLRCANPECLSPETPHVACPICGLSLRNPYRWGRP